MPRTMSVTEARDNFPALVRQVSGSQEEVVITSRNRPQVVILDYEAFQRRRELEEKGARSLLEQTLTRAEQWVGGTLEGYRPDRFELSHFLASLESVLRSLWEICRSLDKPRRMLAVNILDAVLNLRAGDELLTPAHLTALAEVLPLLRRENLTVDDVAAADRRLLAAGLSPVFPVEGDLASLYEPSEEDDEP